MRPSITRAELQQLALLRLAEAGVLLQAGHFDGCFYLCGYALEMALKACICRHLDVPTYPEAEFKGAFKTHDVGSLLLLSGLRNALELKKQQSVLFDKNWSTASGWSVEDRYQINKTAGVAREMFESLEDRQEGVLPWLTQRW